MLSSYWMNLRGARRTPDAQPPTLPRAVIRWWIVLALTACGENGGLWSSSSAAPLDSIPALLNDSLPFKYPIGLYMQLIDDSVTLRLRIDEDGRPIRDSTSIHVHATYPAFDSSALVGSDSLRFRPAYRGGRKVPATVLFPIKFRIPTEPVTPADTTRRVP
jgi:TonB family protein